MSAMAIFSTTAIGAPRLIASRKAGIHFHPSMMTCDGRQWPITGHQQHSTRIITLIELLMLIRTKSIKDIASKKFYQISDQCLFNPFFA